MPIIQADYRNLYSYFAYELPFMPAWGRTQAGNDYFMNQQRGLPSDDILQYEAEQNTCLLWNQVHPDSLRRPLTPYENAIAYAKIKIQEPMLDAPPVAPPRAPVGAFSYIRGQAPPETYMRGYLPFARADPAGPGSGSGQPTQPLQLPNPPQRWALLRFPALIKPPTPPAPWELTNGNTAPYDELKLKVLKEVDDFNGDFSDIT